MRRRMMKSKIHRATVTGAELDYAVVADPGTLEPLERVSGDVRLLVAARFGDVRLIDNLGTSG